MEIEWICILLDCNAGWFRITRFSIKRLRGTAGLVYDQLNFVFSSLNHLALRGRMESARRRAAGYWDVSDRPPPYLSAAGAFAFNQGRRLGRISMVGVYMLIRGSARTPPYDE
ncbi:hypothetical protein EVAR_56554_1 [Eumeta japonica]|uniref:Uncharacterized protein n=1 Tax=Eumeta variegata TaxID=151549 RepID=A0A4C1ZXQ0_EUMVA|nr:hypothetical protein EVAR_56554_1 [Eumeta japonica]